MAEINELTFKPKINKYLFNKYQHPNVQTRLQIWLLKKQNKLNKLGNIYKKENINEKQLTFKPKINKIPKFYKNIGDNDGKSNVQLKISFDERLMQNEIARKQKLRDTRSVVMKSNMKQCTFKPKKEKTKTSVKISKKLSRQMPIWDRIEFETNKLNEKKNNLKKKISETEQPFTPIINETSKKILKKNFDYSNHKNVIERLAKPPQLTINTNIDENNDNIIKENIKPKISSTSNKILKESLIYGKQGQNFFQRQKIYEFEKNMKRNKIEIESKNEITENFKPEIGDANDILAKSIKHGFRIETETKDEMFFRLAFHDVNEINKKIKLKRKEFEKDLTYKPNINKKSKKIGRPSSLYELIQPQKSLNIKNNIINNANKQFIIKHPFKPKIKKYKRSMSLDEKYFSKKYKEIETREILKEKKMQHARRQLDELTMKECTFKPNISKKKKKKKKKNKKNFSKNKKIIIPGWNRFNELKLLKQKKITEKIYNYENAFNVKSKCLKSRKKNANGKLYTVPKPFKLSSNKNDNNDKNDDNIYGNLCKKNIIHNIGNNIENENNELMLIDLNKYNNEIIKNKVWDIVNNVDSDDDNDKSSLNLSWID